jgi:Zn-dependent M28 family amino/carboxypeptidase
MDKGLVESSLISARKQYGFEFISGSPSSGDVKVRLLCILAFVGLTVLIPFLTVAIESDRVLMPTPNLAQDMVEKSRLHSTIQQLQAMGNRMTFEKQWEAAEWISAKLREYGLETVIQKYEWNDRMWPNVTARIQGSQKPEETIMVLAHLDSISYDPSARAPGADDNGSGVAVAMEMGRILSQAGLERTLVIAIFSNEERGQAGSKAYVKSLKDKGGIKAIVNLDVLGYSRPANPLQVKAISVQSNFRGVARSIYRMGRNLYYGISYTKRAIIVAGRPANGELASLVAGALEKYGNLEVRTLVGDDCG